MKIKFKKEQQDIIDASGSNLLVSASAGSGKTTVMIAKIVDMILNKKTTVDRILVLTYTNSAASEMKQKLTKALKDKVLENPEFEEEIEKIETSDISTIHSFCQKLIKKNFYAIQDIDLSFTLLSEHEKTLLKARAMKKTISDFKLKFENEYLNLLEFYGNDRTDRKIFEIVYDLNSYLEATLNKDDFRQEVAITLYENQNLAYDILNKSLMQKVKSFIRTFEKLDKKAKQLDVEKSISNTQDILLALYQLSESNDYLKNINLLLSFKFKNKQTQEGFEALANEIGDEKKNLTEWISKQKLKKLYSKNDNELSFSQNKEIVKQFLFLEKEFDKNFKALKKQRNSLDFADLERYAIFLTENKEISDNLKEKYQYIFIDEFQDANSVQERLLENLARDNNLFMVGDVKQSIYAFRRSNPDIFLKKQKDFNDNKTGKNKFLNLNFRSDENILSFVNLVFDKIMTSTTAGIDYKNTSRFMPFKKLDEGENSRVKIAFIQPKEKVEKKEPEKVFSLLEMGQEDKEEEISKAHFQAFLVARDILKLKNSYLFEGKEKRQTNFKDMTIIVRKRGNFFDAFCEKLVEFGVPIYANSAKGIFDEPDSKKILALLKLVKNFYDDYSLVSVMNSFFADFTLQELADIRLKYKDEKYFYQAVLNYQKNEDDALSKKINNFVLFVEDFSLNVQTIGIFLALNKAFNQTGYKEKVVCLPQGNQRLSSLDKFLQIFLNEELNYNLGTFLEFALVADKEIKAPNFFAGDDDCVNITTIHSSKGLEYPIVFFVEADSDFTRSRNNTEIVINDELGVGLKFYQQETEEKQNSVVYEAINLKNKKEDFAEKLRLLYVGLTRSVEYLYIYGETDITKVKEYENDFQVLSSKSYIELIARSLPNSIYEKLQTENELIISQDKTTFMVEKVLEQSYESEKNTYSGVVFSKGDESFEKEIVKHLNKQYKTPEVFSLPLKNSVSSLLKDVEYSSVNLQPKNLDFFEHLKVKNNQAEIGTLYHKVLETINFNEEITTDKIEEIILNIESPLKEKLNINKIYESANLIKQKLKNKPHQKEKKFMMYVPYNQVAKSDVTEKVLVQGIIDLFALGDENILIDYKFTKAGSDEIIIERYQKQIQLYKKAIMLEYGLNSLNAFILDINRARLIEVI